MSDKEGDDLFADMAGNRDIISFLDRARMCVRCDFMYTERNNLGRWRCKRFHPMEPFTSAHAEVYDCCGRRVGTAGCVPADHTDVLLYSVAPRRLKRQIASLMDMGKLIQSKSWRTDGNMGFIINRVDMETYRERTDVNALSVSEESKLTRPIKTF